VILVVERTARHADDEVTADRYLGDDPTVVSTRARSFLELLA
jgi:hypothetical protein